MTDADKVCKKQNSGTLLIVDTLKSPSFLSTIRSPASFISNFLLYNTIFFG